MPLDPNYPRDLIGYGRHPVQANWPGRARVAVQFVLNYEEGGENCVLHGDSGSEQFLSEIVGAAAYPARHMSMESIYEYGSRAGVWRILGEFEKRGLPLTLDTNDMRFASPQGFNTADHFFTYLRDAFDVLYEEGDEAPKMLSVGMHCRLLGRPGRFRALQRFLNHIEQHDRVWVTRRVDIARHWREHHPYQQTNRRAAA
ncbi:MAG: Uricase (urate oxidase) (EC [uncultured Paraburkholderia sp.]|nr:MAG: Uricase (urate oxidase) (EC [uncultured Paraburkholderia sp.]